MARHDPLLAMSDRERNALIGLLEALQRRPNLAPNRPRTTWTATKIAVPVVSPSGRRQQQMEAVRRAAEHETVTLEALEAELSATGMEEEL